MFFGLAHVRRAMLNNFMMGDRLDMIAAKALRPQMPAFHAVTAANLAVFKKLAGAGPVKGEMTIVASPEMIRADETKRIKSQTETNAIHHQRAVPKQADPDMEVNTPRQRGPAQRAIAFAPRNP